MAIDNQVHMDIVELKKDEEHGVSMITLHYHGVNSVTCDMCGDVCETATCDEYEEIDNLQLFNIIEDSSLAYFRETKCGGEKYATLKWTGGYFSDYDDHKVNIQICQHCMILMNDEEKRKKLHKAMKLLFKNEKQ